MVILQRALERRRLRAPSNASCFSLCNSQNFDCLDIWLEFYKLIPSLDTLHALDESRSNIMLINKGSDYHPNIMFTTYKRLRLINAIQTLKRM